MKKHEPVIKPATRGASVAKTRAADISHAWWQHHRISAGGSLSRLSTTPLQTLMTALVVAIALALPATLLAVLDNIHRLGDRWDSSPKLSVYLQLRAQPTAIAALEKQLKDMPEIKALETISASDALRQFQEHSGFGAALDVLDENPLPTTLVITPNNDYLEPEKLNSLAERIGKDGLVDEVQMDMAWVKKLKAIMALGQQMVLGLAALLSVGVLLAIGNTIRLEIENRREEIVVTKLVGGTNGFVRRPLLYTGAWYGAFGGLLAGILVWLAFLSLDGPVKQLADAYQSEFVLRGLGTSGSLLLLAAGTGLGLLGAWIAIGRHLSAIEPR